MISVTDFKNTLEIMRKCYDFDDDNTFISTERDIMTNTFQRVVVNTVDKETGTEITLARTAERTMRNDDIY